METGNMMGIFHTEAWLLGAHLMKWAQEGQMAQHFERRELWELER
jgi:hypothetical protein